MGLEDGTKIGVSAMELSPVDRVLNTIPVARTLLQDLLIRSGSQRLVEGLEDIWGKMQEFKQISGTGEILTLIEFKEFLGEDVGFIETNSHNPGKN